MEQAIRIFKNEHFDSAVMINIGNKPHTKILEKDRHFFLFNEEELVGINIFGDKLFKDYPSGFIPLQTSVLEELNEFLQEYDLERVSYNLNDYLHVGEVLKASPIKGSSSLTLCEVRTKSGIKEIVCGADNVKEGMKSIVALDQAVLPDGTLIEDGELFGVKSFGMLCSAEELGLDNIKQTSGIIELSEELEIGTGLDDIDWSEY